MGCAGRRQPWSCLGLLLIVPGLVLIPAPARGEDPKLADAIRRGLEPFVDQGEIAGAVALVGDRDKVLSLVTVGRRDVENDLSMQADTLFRIASMTKPITALGILILAEEGKLSVDDPVEKYLPAFRGQKLGVTDETGTSAVKASPRPITLRDLLTHTSGLPNPNGNNRKTASSPPDHPTLAAVADGLGGRLLSFAPGTKWSYSNGGLATLGRIIEVVSGTPYETFLKQRLFDPLGMTDTTFYPTPEQMRRAAVTYDRKAGALQAVASSRTAPSPETSYPSPAGGLYSTAPDLARLYQMLLSGGVRDGRRYVSEATLAEMTRLQTGDLKAGFTPGMGFGLGCGVVRSPEGVTAMLSPGSFGHGGAFGTQGWIDPHKGRFSILMIQRVGLKNADDTPMRATLQRIAFGATAP